MPRLSGRPRLSDLGHRKGEWFVVSVGDKLPAFQVVSEVAHRQVQGQELAVVCRIFELRLAQLPAEEGQGLPLSAHLLLQDGADGDVGRIRMERDRGTGHRVDQQASVRQSGLGGCEGLIHGGGPHEVRRLGLARQGRV